MLDYHLHLWPHGQAHATVTVEQVAAYCERAAAAGVSEIALTEHLFRFVQADGLLAGFWDDDQDPLLRRTMASYWAQHARADLDAYVDTVLAAKAAGLPVVLGLEVDHYAGRMDKVAALLEGYPFDVLLGSVHWLGAWGFDNIEDPVVSAEWAARDVDDVWASYADAMEELAASGACDVVAHPDLVKVTGRRPSVPDRHLDRIAGAIAKNGLAAEVSSAGWRKPVAEAYPSPDLLARLATCQVPVTTASDAHTISDVGAGVVQLWPLLADAGYRSLTAYRGRQPCAVPLPAVPPA
ncbi:MAG: PHP domain-containing protein [Actinomycetota bacterium]|nr:PHP domain-containing protein [Actinomycetota bacterium]